MSTKDIQNVKDLAMQVYKGLESLQEDRDGVGDVESSVRTLRVEFNLWISVNGIFEESMTERFASADDFSLLTLMSRKMRGILPYLAPHTTEAQRQFEADTIPRIRAAVKSLHRLGEAMRTEFPCHRLVKKIRGALNEPHDNVDTLIHKSDVVREIEGLKLGLKTDQVETYATRICSEYKLVFAILLLLFKPIRIFGFLDSGTSDDKLPIQEDFLTDKCRKEGWMAHDAVQFVYFQHLCISRPREDQAIPHNMSPASQERELKSSQSGYRPPELENDEEMTAIFQQRGFAMSHAHLSSLLRPIRVLGRSSSIDLEMAKADSVSLPPSGRSRQSIVTMRSSLLMPSGPSGPSGTDHPMTAIPTSKHWALNEYCKDRDRMELLRLGYPYSSYGEFIRDSVEQVSNETVNVEKTGLSK